MRQNIPIFFLLILSVLLLLHAGDAADLSDPLHVFSFTGLRGDLSGSGGGGAAMKLRGGSIGDCLGCLWPKPDEGKLVNDDPNGVQAVDENGYPMSYKKKKRSRVGKMERSVDIDVPIAKVMRVCGDYAHYQDWTGNGIKKIDFLEVRPGFSHIQYTTGAFGITFHFSLYWSDSVENKITFRNVLPTRLIHLLKGEYQFTELSKTKTSVHFQVLADIRGPIPHIVKVAIAKLLVRIALDDLKVYVTSPECDARLAAYDKEKKTNMLHTVRQRFTKMYNDVPDMVFFRHKRLQKVAAGVVRAGAVALLLSRFINRGSSEASR